MDEYNDKNFVCKAKLYARKAKIFSLKNNIN